MFIVFSVLRWVFPVFTFQKLISCILHLHRGFPCSYPQRADTLISYPTKLCFPHFSRHQIQASDISSTLSWRQLDLVLLVFVTLLAFDWVNMVPDLIYVELTVFDRSLSEWRGLGKGRLVRVRIIFHWLAICREIKTQVLPFSHQASNCFPFWTTKSKIKISKS